MTLAGWFWIVVAFRLVVGLLMPKPDAPNWPWWKIGFSVIDLALIVILGYAVFSGPIKG